ncbi:uncharacterized protein LOC129581786 [Paramacrobiotus metropolitanus]|uniref:uncharacterized protein LOC129581786 n=1 Tax=Paramacrobiotus metropolitanus TaxID=2943436 RepID=UPI002446087A|nr:uncharacterized protein LOC129581786 [Paramacrobiotus metropolitanus]
MFSGLAAIVALLLCGIALAERIASSPDVSWNRRNTDSDRSGSRGSSFSNSDDDRFPITGGSSRFSGNSGNSGSGSNFGSRGTGSGSRDRDDFGSGSSSSRGSSSQDPNYVTIVAALVRLTNADGKTNTGSKCASFGGKCDPLIYANLDTERPNANWPGSKDVKFWPLLLSVKDKNDVDIGIVNITKQYCGQTYKEANLRVHVEDKKMLTSNAIINEFDCVINRDPARDEFSASWSPEQQCIPRYPKGGQILTYKYKVYYVDKFGCGSTDRPSTTTKGSWFG